MRKIAVPILALATFAVAALAHAEPSPEMPAPTVDHVDGTTQTDDVAFKNDGHERMTVPVSVSGSGPFRFMVDTGADRTAISRELAERLKLASGRDASLHSVAGVSTVTTATVPDLKLSRKSVKVMDAPILESANMGADGILGVDSLRSQRVEFDFDANVMSIVPSTSMRQGFDPNEIVITATRRNGRLIFTEARINGRQVTVVLDTGSEISIGNEALRWELMGRNSDATAERVELQSVTGAKLAGDYMFIRRLEMDGIDIRQLAVVFADAHTFRKLSLSDRPALLLGMNAIRAFKKVSIDFANRKFRVVVPESSSLETDVAGGNPALSRASTRGE